VGTVEKNPHNKQGTKIKSFWNYKKIAFWERSHDSYITALCVPKQ